MSWLAQLANGFLHDILAKWMECGRLQMQLGEVSVGG